jgi:hypothetical protein
MDDRLDLIVPETNDTGDVPSWASGSHCGDVCLGEVDYSSFFKTQTSPDIAQPATSSMPSRGSSATTSRSRQFDLGSFFAEADPIVQVMIADDVVPVEEMLNMKANATVLDRAATQILRRSLVRDSWDEFLTPTMKRLRVETNGDGSMMPHLLSNETHIAKDDCNQTWQDREAGHRELLRSLATELGMPCRVIKSTSQRVWKTISERTCILRPPTKT